MNENIRKFLRNMIINNDGYAFMFYQFYMDPESSLGGEDSNTIDDYCNYGNVVNLINRSNFYEFLELCLDDETFMSKIEGKVNLVTKMRFMILYFMDSYNEDRSVFLEILLGILLMRVSKLIANYYEHYNELEEIENHLIVELNNGKYSEVYDKVIDVVRDPFSWNVNYFKAFIGSNKLLELCDNELLDRDLSFIYIDKIMQMIELSIDLYNMDFEEEYIRLYYHADKIKLKEFNIPFAEDIIDRFEEKIKNSKVIRLY